MKAFLFASSLFFLSHSALASNGWSSSGGGEYILDRNNPWFMGDAPVTWCIDHGGEDKFSLDLPKSKIEIEKAITTLAMQLKSINQKSDKMISPANDEIILRRTCGVKKGAGGWEKLCIKNDKRINISDKYIFVPDCSKADIQFILGNYENENIQALIQSMGEENFRNLAGIAMRTEYSLDTLRGRGFIYIAADKGALQYNGPRNYESNIDSPTIWNTYDQMKDDMFFPNNIFSFSAIGKIEYNYNLKLKDYTVSTLLPVVAHEFAHILGVGHNHSSLNGNVNIMDEDYPAQIISDGLVFKGSFLRQSRIFSNGLIETDGEHRIGFEWASTRIKTDDKKNLKKDSPAIYDFLFNVPNKYIVNDEINLFFIFDIDRLDNKTAHMQIATYERDRLEYKILKTFDVELRKCTTPNLVELVSLRLNSLTSPLIQLGNMYFCGKIKLSNGLIKKYLNFKLSHVYFQGNSELELYEANSSEPLSLILNESDILEYSNSEQTLPKPIPEFWF